MYPVGCGSRRGEAITTAGPDRAGQVAAAGDVTTRSLPSPAVVSSAMSRDAVIVRAPLWIGSSGGPKGADTILPRLQASMVIPCATATACARRRASDG